MPGTKTPGAADLLAAERQASTPEPVDRGVEIVDDEQDAVPPAVRAPAGSRAPQLADPESSSSSGLRGTAANGSSILHHGETEVGGAELDRGH